MTEHVVVDVDPGIDDAYALAVLIGAQKLGVLKIAAIVCSAGNTSRKKACFNLVRILITLNAYDIPVFEGSWRPIVRPQLYSHHYGRDGFGDIFDQPSSPFKLNTTEEFCRYIETRFRPKKVTMLCFAPLTLPAGFLLQHYQIFFKEVWIMGGNHPDYLLPYWTFARDPEAVDVVLKRAKAPITIVPWKMSHDLGVPMKFRSRILASVQQPFMVIMNMVERKAMHAKKEWIMPNVVMAAAFSFPEMAVNSIKEFVEVNREYPTSNMTGLLIKTCSKQKAKVRIITELDCKAYRRRVLETINQTHLSSFTMEHIDKQEETDNSDPNDEYGWTSI